MKKFLVGIILMIAMATSALAATSPWGGAGWHQCNTAGNYGGFGQDQNCYIVWDGVNQACTDATKNATFTVGQVNTETISIDIDHLNGIADTMDGFDVLDSNGNVICSFPDSVPQSTETWGILHCPVSLNGVQTLTIAPKATAPWDNGGGLNCATYGQVAIKNITFETQQIPEFGTIAAMVALAGAVTAFFVVRKH
jgi:hypothetical protein